MKANKPKYPKEKITFDNVNPDEFDKHFITIKRGTYVSKSAYGKLQTAHKKLDKFIDGYTKEHYILESDYYALKSDNTKLIKIKDDLVVCCGKLESENSELKSSFSQLAEDREAHIKNYNLLFDSHRDLQTDYNEMDIKFCDNGQELCNTREELETEKKIAKFNFRWAMIATAAFILSIIYILIH